MPQSHLNDVKERLASGKLKPEDISFINALLSKAESEGLGEAIGNKRVVARLPNGMDIVK